MKSNRQRKRQPLVWLALPEKNNGVSLMHTITRPAVNKQSTFDLKIPMEYAGLLHQVLRFGFLEVWVRSEPEFCGDSGPAQLALADLREDLKQQFRQKVVPE
jgi:hypothetical protein